MYILTREPPSQSSAEDLPSAETFRATVTTTGSAESLVFCCTVMNNTSKPEKILWHMKLVIAYARLKPLFHFWLLMSEAPG